jgi:hypothetical protein
MRLKRWNEVVYDDCPKMGLVTQDSLEQMRLDSLKYGGSARMAMGRIWTDEEFEAYRESVLSRPLP